MARERLIRFFSDYASYHQTHGNQLCHMFGIPMIVLSLLGLLGGVQIAAALNAGLLLWALAVLWYLVLDWKLAVPFALVALGVYFVGRAIPTPVLWGLFIGGWIIQFVGHKKYEKNSPAFYKNAEHLLIGPFWVFAKLIGYRPSP